MSRNFRFRLNSSTRDDCICIGQWPVRYVRYYIETDGHIEGVFILKNRGCVKKLQKLMPMRDPMEFNVFPMKGRLVDDHVWQDTLQDGRKYYEHGKKPWSQGDKGDWIKNAFDAQKKWNDLCEQYTVIEPFVDTFVKPESVYPNVYKFKSKFEITGDLKPGDIVMFEEK